MAQHMGKHYAKQNESNTWVGLNNLFYKLMVENNNK
jgi:hypothetical protein